MGRRYTYEEYLRKFCPEELRRLEQSRKAETAEEVAKRIVRESIEEIVKQREENKQ